VTFTPTADAGHLFAAWTGATCTGYTSGPDDAITFTGPTTAHACSATFALPVTVSYSSTVPGLAVITATASKGSCVENPVPGMGSCTVPSGHSTVTLTAPPTAAGLFVFTGWSCTASGPHSAAILTLVDPTGVESCVAAYAFVPPPPPPPVI
jgi:hypothetical protein